jgi:hypothetical protein
MVRSGNMNIYNYLYNISLLELIIEMEHQETKIEPGYLDFWIEVGGLDYSMRFEQYGLSFDFVDVGFRPKGLHIEYNRDAKEMELIWHVQKK